MLELKQSTSATVKIGPFVDDADGKTAETGLTISQADVRLSKNGGDMAQKGESSSCTHDELGYYDCALNATDTGTLGRLQLMVHESGALPVWHEFAIISAAVYDRRYGTALPDVNVEKWNGVDVPAGQTDGYPQVSLQTAAVAAVADGVWDEALAGHTSAGSMGEALDAAGDPFAGTSAEVAAGAEPTTHAGLLRMIYNRFYRRGELTDSALKTYVKNAGGGATGVLTSQNVSDDGTTQIQQQATYP